MNKYLVKIAGMLDVAKRVGNAAIADAKAHPKAVAATVAGGIGIGALSNHNTNKRLRETGKPTTAMNRFKDQVTHII